MEARVFIAGISGYVIVDVENCKKGLLKLSATQALALSNFLAENYPTLSRQMNVEKDTQTKPQEAN